MHMYPLLKRKANKPNYQRNGVLIRNGTYYCDGRWRSSPVQQMMNIENCAGQKLRRLRLADCGLGPRVSAKNRTGTGLDAGGVLGVNATRERDSLK